jgi:hypothetical protein
MFLTVHLHVHALVSMIVTLLLELEFRPLMLTANGLGNQRARVA